MSNYSSGVLNRRKRTLQRLETQLKSGVKPLFVEGKQLKASVVDLTESDIKRIEKEIMVLKAEI
jgi:hypothetical protein